MAEPLLVIVGETASGKSALAMQLAADFDGELICADAMTVYKEFDIGTAKSSPEEQSAIPHHLLDVTTADKGFAAPAFKQLAEEAIEAISARGKLPIIVGGSGLYVDSVLYDYQFLEKSDPELRTKLNEMKLTELLELSQVKQLDMTGIDLRNKRRIIRHIENNGVVPTRSGLRSQALVIGVRLPRKALDERIVARVDAMLAAGLEAEVHTLVKQYGWDNEPMKSIGYREWQKYFDGTQSLGLTGERIIAGTRRLAKKQRTWFGRNQDIVWVDTVAEARMLFSSWRIDNSSPGTIKTSRTSP